MVVNVRVKSMNMPQGKAAAMEWNGNAMAVNWNGME